MYVCAEFVFRILVSVCDVCLHVRNMRRVCSFEEINVPAQSKSQNKIKTLHAEVN